MRPFSAAVSSLIALVLSTPALRSQAPSADTSPSVLRLLPDRADLLIQAPEPRRLIETLTSLDTLKQIQQLAPVREFLDGANARRFFQLVAYFEKELGLPWPQMIDRLASRGIALGVEFGPSPAPVLLVIEGEDERMMQQFSQLGLRLLEQELARQEGKVKLIKGSYKGCETVHLGAELHAAVAGSALFLSNSEKALHAGLDRQQNGGKKSMADLSGVREAAQLMPRQPLATVWLNMEKIKQSPQAKATYQAPPRDDPLATVVFGHYFNLLGRSPYVCAAVFQGNEGLAASIFMPRGRQGIGADQLLHLPPPDAPGSRPLLKPKNVIYSDSGYFDLANIWKERKTLFNDKQVRELEKFDKESAPFLIGSRLNKLLTQAGPYYRFVAVHQPRVGYKTTPKISILAFSLVWELRKPEAFAKSVETILRGAALLGGFDANLRLVEEQYNGCKLIGYRFPEDQPLKGDTNDLRFNFAPCFTRVGDQFVAASTIELCRELVDLVHEQGAASNRGNASPARIRLHGAGVAAYLRTVEDLLITRTMLDQAVTPKEARQQIKTFFDILGGLGVLALEPHYYEKMFRYDIRLQAVPRP